MQHLSALLSSVWFYVFAISVVVFLVIRLWSGWYSGKVTDALEKILAAQAAASNSPVQSQQLTDSTLTDEIRRDITNQILALPNGDRLPTLVNRLADAVVGLKFEAVYRIIYSSQIGFLEILAAGPRTRAASEEIFRQLVPANVIQAGLTLDEWARYLVEGRLVVLTADGFAIGRDGQEFLVWKIRHGIPSKP